MAFLDSCQSTWVLVMMQDEFQQMGVCPRVDALIQLLEPANLGSCYFQRITTDAADVVDVSLIVRRAKMKEILGGSPLFPLVSMDRTVEASKELAAMTAALAFDEKLQDQIWNLIDTEERQN